MGGKLSEISRRHDLAVNQARNYAVPGAVNFEEFIQQPKLIHQFQG